MTDPDDRPHGERPSILDTFGLGQVATGLRFDGEDVSEAELTRLAFDDCQFHDCNFAGSAIRDCTFTRSRFAHCSFAEAAVAGSKFASAEEGSGCTWSFCDFAEARLSACNLSLCRFEKGLLYEASFEKCAAMGLAFDADVHRSIRGKVIRGGVAFIECRLQYAAFQAKDLSHSRFERCDLRDVSFRRSNLSDCSFAGSALNNTDFEGATLDRATIAYASFDELKLDEMASHSGLMVSREQTEAILRGLGIVVAG